MPVDLKAAAAAHIAAMGHNDAMEVLFDELIAEIEQLRAALSASRTAQAPQQEEPIEHFWTAVERGWDIEPRAYFEKEAVPMGFKSPVEMAVHWMWKRHAKDWPNDELAAAQARIQVLETSVDYLRNLIDHPVKQALWSPISTAPKDGTHLLVCDARRPYTAFWGFGQNPPTVGHYFAQGWHLSVNHDGEHSEIQPTHWMTLPAPPVAPAEGEP